MFVEERMNKASVTYSIICRGSDGKRLRLKKEAHPHFTDLAAAEAWCRAQAGIYASRKAAHERKLAWRTQYHNFNELLTKFTGYQKKKAPNSWESNLGYLKNWIFPFYLTQKQMGNVNDWHLAFEDFRDWISSNERKGYRGHGDHLSVSTQNNIIKTLNVFLTCLGTYGLIDKDSVKKCPPFPEDFSAQRGIESIISAEERDAVYKSIAAENQAAADFFLVLWHTGMRFSELFGLPITSLKVGKMTNVTFHEGLTKHGINYMENGYLYLESQPDNDECKRKVDKSLGRKPLKGCAAISPKFSRYIPIEDSKIWKILANRFNDGKDRFAKKEFTAAMSDYRIFEDLTWHQLNVALKKAYIDLQLEPKSYHCCRHTFTTLSLGRTLSTVITRAITGHRKEKSFERYNHLFELLSMQSEQEDQDIPRIE